MVKRTPKTATQTLKKAAAKVAAKKAGAKKAAPKAAEPARKPAAKNAVRKAVKKAVPAKAKAAVKPGQKAVVKTAPKRKAPPVRPGRTVVDAVRSPEPSTLDGETFSATRRRPRRGIGAEFAGQSGDLQGLSRREAVDSESVEELTSEGQYREAGIVSAVEDALDPDAGEVRTRQVQVDDVPEEYLDND